MSNVIIPVKERNLLLNSEVIGDYPLLLKRLEKHNSITEADIKDATQEELDIYEIRQRIFEQAKKEWEKSPTKTVDIVDKNENIKCDICNAPSLQEIHYIVNKINKKELRVGSTCITYFKYANQQEVDALIKDAKRLRRLTFLNNEVSGIDSIISQWDNFLINQPIIINDGLQQKYVCLGDEAKSIYSSFLKNDKNYNEEKLNRLKQIMKEKEQEKTKILDYVEKHKTDALYPPRQIFERMDTQGVDWLKKDGVINHGTLWRIKNNEVAKKIFEQNNKFFLANGISIKDVNTERGVKYTIRKQANIILTANFPEFCKNCGMEIVQNTEKIDAVKQKTLSEIGKVVDSKSLDNLLYTIQAKYLKNSKYRIADIYPEYNDVYIKVRLENEQKIFKVDLLKMEIVSRELAFSTTNSVTTNKKKLFDFIDGSVSDLNSLMDFTTYNELKKGRDRSYGKQGFN